MTPHDHKNLNCIFCRIIDRDASAFIVFEDDVSIAFLDARPLFPGHCLLTPKQHVETFTDLAPDLVGPLFKTAQLLTKTVEKSMGADGSFVAMNNRVSQSVPHLHIHVVPRRKKDGLKGFFWPRHGYKDEEQMKEYADRIAAELKNSG